MHPTDSIIGIQLNQDFGILLQNLPTYNYFYFSLLPAFSSILVVQC